MHRDSADQSVPLEPTCWTTAVHLATAEVFDGHVPAKIDASARVRVTFRAGFESLSGIPSNFPGSTPCQIRSAYVGVAYVSTHSAGAAAGGLSRHEESADSF